MGKEYYPPIPVTEEKQCYECKHYRYDGESNMSHCKKGNGWGSWSVIDSGGTCEDWEGYSP